MEEVRSYSTLTKQLGSLIEGEQDRIANLANIAALIRQEFNWFWIGFYLVKSQELVLGPFQGPLACTRIGWGKGVCGTAWKDARTIRVEDVHEFPGHIACSPLSRSEIVVPIYDNTEIVAVLDVDSDRIGHFTTTDQKGLEQIAELIGKHWHQWT